MQSQLKVISANTRQKNKAVSLSTQFKIKSRTKEWHENCHTDLLKLAVIKRKTQTNIKLDRVIITIVIRPLNDPTWCAQSVVVDLRPLCLGVRKDRDELIRYPAHVFQIAPY